MRSTRLWLAALAAALLAVACSRKPATIDISPKKVKLYGIDRSTRLTARLLDKKGQPFETGTPTWSSSNPAVVEAEAGGRVVAKKEGKATVSAQYEGLQAQVPVEVVDVSTIEVSSPQLTLIGPPGTSVPLSFTVKNSAGQSVALTPVWTSQNPKVATVSEDGRVTAVGAGATTIVGKIGDVQGGTDVAVKLHDIVRLEVHPATALVRVGDSQHFTVTAFGADGLPIPEVAAAFQSSNAGVASVDPSGLATGRHAGAATIKAELAGVTGEATLLVN
jgi:trimeric autotransporter adhesin